MGRHRASFLARPARRRLLLASPLLREGSKGAPVKDGGDMHTQDFVTFQDVEAISSNGLGLLCRVNGKEVWVPYANMARRECTVRRPGDCGLLVVPHWLAVNLWLLDRAASSG